MSVTVLSQRENYSDHRLKSEDRSSSGSWIDTLNVHRAPDLSESPDLVQISHFCGNKASNDNTQPALASHPLLDKKEQKAPGKILGSISPRLYRTKQSTQKPESSIKNSKEPLYIITIALQQNVILGGKKKPLRAEPSSPFLLLQTAFRTRCPGPHLPRSVTQDPSETTHSWHRASSHGMDSTKWGQPARVPTGSTTTCLCLILKPGKGTAELTAQQKKYSSNNLVARGLHGASGAGGFKDKREIIFTNWTDWDSTQL